MKRATGDGDIGIGFLGDGYGGEAFEREAQPSEFGLPEGYVDPYAYRGKTPPCVAVDAVSPRDFGSAEKYCRPTDNEQRRVDFPIVNPLTGR